MNVRIIALATLLCLSAPAIAIAQAQTTPNANAGASAGGATDTNQVGSGATLPDFDTFLQNFSNADFSSAMGDIAAASTFHVVKLSTMENADAARLQSAIETHEQGLADLRAAVSATEGAKAALESEGVSTNQVVWIASEAEGEMTLYVSDFETM
jgi:hypothetical protein